MTVLVQHDAAALIDDFQSDLRNGRHWLDALLHVVARWDLHAEVIDGREYRYLIADEAFDWLLLAERLCDAVTVAAPGLLPEAEVDALLLEERFPLPMDEETFKECLGAAKYRAHLNFLYGVRVEEALQLAWEEQIQKERRSGLTGLDNRIDEDTFQRIYGATRLQLVAEYRDAHGRPMIDRISLSELIDFTYWLFKWRVAKQEPARMASDTRRGIQRLARLQELKQRRAGRPVAEPIDIIEIQAVPVR